MPGETLVIVFPSRTVLVKALDYLKDQSYLNIDNAVLVARATSGEVVIVKDRVGPDEGAIAGGTLGAAMTALGLVQLGALALPGIGSIIALGTGVLIGGFIGRMTGRFATYLTDVGYQPAQVDALAQQLKAGHPALVLELRGSAADVLPRLREDLKGYQAELVERLREVWRKPPEPPGT